MVFCAENLLVVVAPDVCHVWSFFWCHVFAQFLMPASLLLGGVHVQIWCALFVFSVRSFVLRT